MSIKPLILFSCTFHTVKFIFCCRC